MHRAVGLKGLQLRTLTHPNRAQQHTATLFCMASCSADPGSKRSETRLIFSTLHGTLHALAITRQHANPNLSLLQSRPLEQATCKRGSSVSGSIPKRARMGWEGPGLRAPTSSLC